MEEPQRRLAGFRRQAGDGHGDNANRRRQTFRDRRCAYARQTDREKSAGLMKSEPKTGSWIAQGGAAGCRGLKGEGALNADRARCAVDVRREGGHGFFALKPRVFSDHKTPCQIAYGAADEDIRGKMVATCEARYTHGGCVTVGA